MEQIETVNEIATYTTTVLQTFKMLKKNATKTKKIKNMSTK